MTRARPYRAALLIGLALLVVSACSGRGGRAFPQDGLEAPPSYLVGAHYLVRFPEAFETSLRPQLVPPQQPVLGLYDASNLAVVETHIEWAAQHGVDFFVLPYSRDPARKEEPDQRLQLFPHASNIDDIQFCLSFSPGAKGDSWGTSLRHIADFMHHPRYLKWQGHPVLVVRDPGPELTRADLIGLREALGRNVFLVGAQQVWRGQTPSPQRLELFDAVTPLPPAGADLESRGGYGADSPLVADLRRFQQDLREGGVPVFPLAFPGLNERAFIANSAIVPRAWEARAKPTSFLERLLTVSTLPAVDPDVPILLLDSWNDWPRDTALEPLRPAEPTARDSSGRELLTGGYSYSGTGMLSLQLLREQLVAVAGFAVDRQSGYPLANAPVGAWDDRGLVAMDVTDSRGRFRLSRLSMRPGLYEVGLDPDETVEVIVDAKGTATFPSQLKGEAPVAAATPAAEEFAPYFAALDPGLKAILEQPPGAPVREVDGFKLRSTGPEEKDLKPDVVESRLLAGQTVVEIDRPVLDVLRDWRRVGPAGRVIALQADPRRLRDLRADAKLNQASNIEAYGYSVGRRAGWLPSGVESRSLDSFHLSKVSVLRLGRDCSAIEVIAGAGALLRDKRPLVIFDHVDPSQYAPLRAALAEWSYRYLVVEGQGLGVPLEVGADTTLLDLGGPDSRDLLEEGFSIDEVESPTTNYVWSDQAESLLALPLGQALPQEYVLGLRARALDALGTVRVDLLVNGARAGQVEIGSHWTGVEVPIPDGLLVEGRTNSLLLRYGMTARPYLLTDSNPDERALSVALDKVWLCPAQANQSR